jgi:hypothetical protein
MLICLLIAGSLNLGNFILVAAVAGAVLVFLPLFFASGSSDFIPYSLVLAFPVAGSLLARVIENRRTGNETAGAPLQ